MRRQLGKTYGHFFERRFLPRHGITFANKVRLLSNGGQAYPAMLDAVATATSHVDVCMYIFRDDRIGMLFAEALAERARHGCQVRVAYDAVGCADAGERQFALMRQAGVKLHCVNPLMPNRITRFWRAISREHRKIITVDGRVGFIGGINIGDEYDGDGMDETRFRDFVVEMRGPAADYLHRLMDRTFRNSWGPAPHMKHPAARYEPTMVWFQSPRPLSPRRTIVNTYINLIRNATRYVWIANAYFLPNHRVVNAMIRAVRRGVDVRLLLPEKSDIPIVRLASQLWYHHLLRHGIKIFERRSAILHAKAAVADDAVAIMGSANLDARGFYLNREVIATIYDEPFACSLRDELVLDFQHSHPIEMRHVEKYTFIERIKQHLAYAISPLL
ncbi:MAG: hypothetical protein EHM48_06185 [Planctomycetaceae bacterium]|nr:MAG: hypothetical protein EHM48_06185 [Planctomycetaceae bacterium]